jgi:hypothetical protein
VIHIDPDFKNLSLLQRQIAVQALHIISEHGEKTRSSGVTQIKLINAIGSSLLGVDTPKSSASSDRAKLMDDFSTSFSDVKTNIKQRLFQLFILAELVLDPMPQSATKSLREIADILEIEDEFIDIAREYSAGAYGIAALDLHRKGYLGNPDLIKKGSEMMRVNKSLTDPCEKDEEDPELLKQWMALEN